MTRRNPETWFRPLWLALSCLWATLAQAVTASELVLTQAVAEGARVTAYVAVRDESGLALTDLDTTQLRATVGARAATVEEAVPFAATGEGVLTFLLVDVSRSLDAARFARIRQALHAWVDALGEHDQAALITFGAQVQTRVAPTADRAALNAAIEQLAPTDDRTALHQALATALALGRQRAEGLPSRRAIVILSDGLDDAPGGMSADEVLARLDEGSVPIMAIGFGQTQNRAQREAGLTNLGRLARGTGGFLIDASAGDDPGAAYAALRERLRDVTRVRLQCADCVADGQRQRLRIALTRAGLTLDDGMDVRLYPEAVTPVIESPPPAEATPPTDTAPEPPASPENAAADAATAAATNDAAPPPASALSTALDAVAAALPEPLQPLFNEARAWLAQWWPYVVGAVIVLMLIILGLTAKARVAHRTATVSNPKPEQVEQTPPAPEPPFTRMVVPPASPAIRLTFMSGPRWGQTVRVMLAPVALLGRVPGGPVGTTLAVPEDDEISARHARLSLSGETLILEDLGSTNGTWLNGVLLSAPYPVREGDVLRFGQTELRLSGVEFA